MLLPTFHGLRPTAHSMAVLLPIRSGKAPPEQPHGLISGAIREGDVR